MSRLNEHRGGYMLLESILAVIVMSLLGVGIAQALVAQERLVGKIENWVKDSPTYFVEPSQVGLERLLGAPAQLLGFPLAPGGGMGGSPSDSNLVEVLSWSNRLDPLATQTTVRVTSTSGGGEGCSHGYWKQPQHFASWPVAFTPSTMFSSVFENAFPGQTMLDALELEGDGLEALGRTTVAALLNAESPLVNYDLATGQVIGLFDAVHPGTDAEYNALKDYFAGFNEQVCPGE